VTFPIAAGGVLCGRALWLVAVVVFVATVEASADAAPAMTATLAADPIRRAALRRGTISLFFILFFM